MASGEKRSRWGFLSILAGTVLGVLSLLMASYNPLWDFLGVAPDLRAGQSTGLAIFFICVGFLMAVFFQQGDFKSEVLTAQDEKLAKLIASIPTAGLFSYYTGEKSMAMLAALLPTTRTAFNTRILPPKLSISSHSSDSPWDVAVRKAVESGLFFREVVSTNDEALARERRKAADGGNGVYEASVLRSTLPSFMNFIILEGMDGSKEVWFGWVVSRGSGFEGTVIRTAETRIVTLFERWHSELFAAGSRIP